MESDKPGKIRDDLIKVAADTKAVAPKLIEKGKTLCEAGQRALDWANVIEDFARDAPLERLSPLLFLGVPQTLRDFNARAQAHCDQRSDEGTLLYTTTVLATGTSVSISSGISSYLNWPETAAEKAVSSLLHRDIDIEKLKLSLTTRGFGMNSGAKRSPLQNLEAAHEALLVHGTPAAVLLPLRESIYGLLHGLLRLRPKQEAAKSIAAQVSSIGAQLALPGGTAERLRSIGTVAHALVRDLSQSKDQEMSRERLSHLFDQGVSLLSDLLGLVEWRRSLDASQREDSSS